MSQTSNNDYILGTGQDELSRLGLQHRVWADAAATSWKCAGIGPGSHVIDLGSGPGYATVDLAQLITSTGKLLAIDQSKNYVEFLKQKAQALNLPQVHVTLGDVEALTATIPKNEKYDVIYCRWVLCWLKNPEKALQGMYEVLKPGGKIIIHDYFNWISMAMAPRSQAIEKMVRAAVQSFDEGGGDIDISAHLPRLLKEYKFNLTHFEVHQRVARGGGVDSTVWWILTWWSTYGPKLHKMGKLTDQDMEQIFKDLDRLQNEDNCFFVCPPVFEFIAQK